MKAWARFLHLFRHDWQVASFRARIAVCRLCKREGWAPRLEKGGRR